MKVQEKSIVVVLNFEKGGGQDLCHSYFQTQIKSLWREVVLNYSMVLFVEPHPTLFQRLFSVDIPDLSIALYHLAGIQ